MKTINVADYICKEYNLKFNKEIDAILRHYLYSVGELSDVNFMDDSDFSSQKVLVENLKNCKIEDVCE
jgi:hypothetical protein